jgi:DNA polymerase III sliding clamp (beta) subunit (PCNA family)
VRLAVGRQALYDALRRVVKIAPPSAPNPVLTYVKIEAFDGELFVSATDLTTRIVAEVTGQLKVEQPGVCLLPAQPLTQALRASAAAWVGLAATGPAQVQMGIGRTSYQWKTLPPEHFPDILTLNTEAEHHVLDRSSFLDVMAAVRPAIPTGADARFDQVGIRAGLFQAADGTRFHQAFAEDAALVNAALPADFLTKVTGLLGAATEDKLTLGLSEDTKAISIRVGAMTLITRARAEDFPDVSAVFATAQDANQQSLQVERDELLSAIRRVRTVADPESGAVALKLSPTEIAVSARQPSGSRASEPVGCSLVGQPRTLVLHHSHLVGLLEMVDPGPLQLLLGPDSRTKPGSVYLHYGTRTAVIYQLRMRWFDADL